MEVVWYGLEVGEVWNGGYVVWTGGGQGMEWRLCGIDWRWVRYGMEVVWYGLSLCVQYGLRVGVSSSYH